MLQLLILLFYLYVLLIICYMFPWFQTTCTFAGCNGIFRNTLLQYYKSTHGVLSEFTLQLSCREEINGYQTVLENTYLHDEMITDKDYFHSWNMPMLVATVGQGSTLVTSSRVRIHYVPSSHVDMTALGVTYNSRKSSQPNSAHGFCANPTVVLHWSNVWSRSTSNICYVTLALIGQSTHWFPSRCNRAAAWFVVWK